MEKINIAEILKDCPLGMELDSTNYDGVVKFEGFNKNNPYPIRIVVAHDGVLTAHSLTKYGQTSISSYNKCVIFPKGKTTWEGFAPPCNFKDGEFLTYHSTVGTTIFIHRNKKDERTYKTSFYVGLNGRGKLLVYDKYTLIALNGDADTCLATEEEKEKLLQAIKDNGYRWNAESKTLESLVEAKFKVGDCIRLLVYNNVTYTVIDMTGTHYTVKSNGKYVCEYSIPISTQDKYELAPKKFDVNTLKPFDKVLVRTERFTPIWTIDFFDGYYPEIGGSFTPFGVTGGKYFQQCIPYEGNEHLRGTTNDCNDFYKTW